MNIIIRPPKAGDAEAINDIRRQKGVRENILSLSSERVCGSERFLEGAGPQSHLFVAEVDSKVVGMAGLEVHQSPRKSHVGRVGIMVARESQGIGIGRRLMEEVLDLADNWLLLVRVELDVFASNGGAIRLYESLGFVKEGVRRFGAARCGHYEDEWIMARYRPEFMKGRGSDER